MKDLEVEFGGSSQKADTNSKREVATSMGIANRSHRERGLERDPCMYNLEPVVTLQRVASRANRGQTVTSMEGKKEELSIDSTASSITNCLCRKNKERTMASNKEISLSRHIVTNSKNSYEWDKSVIE